MSNIIRPNTGILGYHGHVKVELMNKKRVLAYHESSNSGLMPLFKHLCAVLAGHADAVKSSVAPESIVLYTLRDETVSASSTWEQLTTSDEVGNCQLKAATALYPVFASTYSEAVATAVATFQFKVPVINITADNIYAFALFPAEATGPEDFSKALAFYKLTNKGNTWDVISVDTSSTQNNFVIEWQMELGDISSFSEEI